MATASRFESDDLVVSFGRDGKRKVRVATSRLVAVVGIATPLVASGILVPWRTSFPNTDAALVLVGVVVTVAMAGYRAAGYLAAVSSALSFDYFLTRPFDTFRISNHNDIQTTLLVLAVGIAVTEIAVRSRHHRSVALEESSYIVWLHEVAEMVVAGEDPSLVTIRVAHYLTELLSLVDCRFDYSASSEHPPILERTGEVIIAGLVWGTDDMGLPGKEVELMVNGGGARLGRFVLLPNKGVPISLERRLVAVALADQVGAAMVGAAV